MGISDRDYMKHRPEDDDEDRRHAAATEAKVVEKLARFFEKHPRFGVMLGLVLALIILTAAILARR